MKSAKKDIGAAVRVAVADNLVPYLEREQAMKQLSGELAQQVTDLEARAKLIRQGLMWDAAELSELPGILQDIKDVATQAEALAAAMAECRRQIASRQGVLKLVAKIEIQHRELLGAVDRAEKNPGKDYDNILRKHINRLDSDCDTLLSSVTGYLMESKPVEAAVAALRRSYAEHMPPVVDVAANVDNAAMRQAGEDRINRWLSKAAQR